MSKHSIQNDPEIQKWMESKNKTKKMKRGIETHRWGYYTKGDNQLIGTCIASTRWEAISYFEEIELDYYSVINEREIKIIDQNKDE